MDDDGDEDGEDVKDDEGDEAGDADFARIVDAKAEGFERDG